MHPLFRMCFARPEESSPAHKTVIARILSRPTITLPVKINGCASVFGFALASLSHPFGFNWRIR